MSRPPLAVAVVAAVYVAAGTIGFVYHAAELTTSGAEVVAIEAVRLVAIVAGVFLWRGDNWARWVAIAWIVFHVIVGALHGWVQFSTHLLFAAIISWVLTRPAANRWLQE